MYRQTITSINNNFKNTVIMTKIETIQWIKDNKISEKSFTEGRCYYQQFFFSGNRSIKINLGYNAYDSRIKHSSNIDFSDRSGGDIGVNIVNNNPSKSELQIIEHWQNSLNEKHIARIKEIISEIAKKNEPEQKCSNKGYISFSVGQGFEATREENYTTCFVCDTYDNAQDEAFVMQQKYNEYRDWRDANNNDHNNDLWMELFDFERSDIWE